jgi:UDP-N-acetylglucosamine 2-epimerase (non-hydrolysing)
MEPFGFFDFVALEKNALCVLTDSGTVQEETCILGVPAVTIRDVTERPETIESGSNVLASVIPDLILDSIKVVLDDKDKWKPPEEYLERNVSSKVVKIVLGYHHNNYLR